MTDLAVSPRSPVPRLARAAVLPPMAVLAVTLLATSGRYGYERDELYFRMLPPAWGYVDQPPLTPLIVHAIARIADTTTAIRLPAIGLAVGSVLVVASIAREVGGGRLAQALAAWGVAVGAFTLIAGHVFLTASWDLVVWPLVLLAVFRARLRADPRWWLLAGAVAGLSLLNKLLIVVLLAAIVAGVLVVGPRRGLANRWTLGAVGLTAVLGSPSLIYQVRNGFPQLAMGAALQAHKASSVRPEVVPLLLLWLGPLLAPVWIAGLVTLIRRPQLRPIRFAWLAFVLVVALVVAIGTQPYYPYGALTAVFGVGSVPTARWARTRGRRALLVAAVGITAAVNAVLALPLVPVSVIGGTPIPAIDQADADSIGWPAYVHEIAGAYRSAGARAIVLAGNYGEAGAMNRYAPSIPTYSGQNALHTLPAPPADTQTIVAIDQPWLRAYFASCRTVGHLDDHLAVENEEQGAPISICTRPVRPIAAMWAAAAHLD